MPELIFPSDRIVGTVDWVDSYTEERGPVLATGVVAAPDGADVDLDVTAWLGSERQPGGGWILTPAPHSSVDLGFVSALPPDVITGLMLHGDTQPESLSTLPHLAPGLRRLYLGWTDYDDDVLQFVAQLTSLTYLQTFGNRFTDAGVQQLVALQSLEGLYLEESTLTAAAFRFAGGLPRLRRVGLQDVPLSPGELDALRSHLPGVDVG